MQWLYANRTMVIGDFHRAFLVKFRRDDVTAANLHGLRKRKGWKVGRAPGRLAGRHKKFNADEIAWLRANAALPIGDFHRGFCTAFARKDMSAPKLHALRKRKGWKTGRTGRFAKGSVPANKGKKMRFNANSARTQFKKGQRPANIKFAGHERVNSQGYVEISIEETNPHTGFERRYVHKHRWLWEKANGPVPEGMVLKCKGDKLDTGPENWKLVPRGVLPRLNNRWGRNYDAAPDEVRPTIMAVAELEHQLHAKRKAAAA